MFQHLMVRSGIGLPAAALIVWALFSFMTSIIRTEFIPPEPQIARDLTAFVMPPAEKQLQQFDRTPPARISVLVPPPLPTIAGVVSDVGLPSVTLDASPPATVDSGVLDALNISPVMYANRIAVPLSPPAPVYPQKLATRSIEGNCEVRFDLDERGRPFNVSATCTHDGFVREAIRSIRKVQFAPEIVDGRAQIRQNVVYPFEFRLGAE